MLSINESRLDNLLTQLEQARSWSARTISKLETLIRAEGATPLFRLDPLTLARDKNLSDAEAINLLLHAAQIGLFTMAWCLVCVSRGGVVESFRQLANVHAHFVCRVCSTINTATLDDLIRVGFTLSETARPLKFHHPENLAVMAAFLTPPEAVQAALAMNRAIPTFNQHHAARLALKIDLHHGHSIAVTLNERLDYFGQTVNIAARAQALAGAGEIGLSDDLYVSLGVAEALPAAQPEQAALTGGSVPMTVGRLQGVRA
jgi:hypothetical protein